MKTRVSLTPMGTIPYTKIVQKFTITRLAWFSIWGLALSLVLPVIRPPVFMAKKTYDAPVQLHVGEIVVAKNTKSSAAH